MLFTVNNVVYSKQCCLQRNNYDQSLRVTDILQNFITVCCFVFELWVLNLKKKKKEKEKMNNSLS